MKYIIAVSTGVSSESNSTALISMLPAVKSSSAASASSKSTQLVSILPTPTASNPPSTSVPPTKVTDAPIIQTTSAAAPTTPRGRQFDGASFAGGIILGVVLTVIFIFAFKWWQTRNKSYHSL